MKYIVITVTLASLGAIIYGFSLKEEAIALAHQYIGFGTLGLFFVAMPLFLYKESKSRKMKDYMLTQENVKKMNAKENKKSKNKS